VGGRSTPCRSRRRAGRTRRTGPKGSGRLEPITWDEALSEIATQFRAPIAEHGGETVMPVSYLGNQGILNGLSVGDGFFHRLGATVTERTSCDSGACTAYAATIGATAGVDPESIVHSRYIILWATNTISTNLHLWPIIAEAQRNGAKVVCIDPMRHRTAQRADWHIPIRPGTDGALALAMMNVIITEGLIDADYVAQYTHGYDELVERVAQYTPEWASAETGIPVEDIRTLAREYATTDPSMIRIGVAVERHAGGGQTVRSLDRLPARPRRGVAPRRRRTAAAAAVGAPSELARLLQPTGEDVLLAQLTNGVTRRPVRHRRPFANSRAARRAHHDSRPGSTTPPAATNDAVPRR
jgi:anaerobic selenocysteine-containing dehydrogenase